MRIQQYSLFWGNDQPFMAAGAWVKVVRVGAASYLMACDEALRREDMSLTYRGYFRKPALRQKNREKGCTLCEGSFLRSILITPTTSICRPSSSPPSPQPMPTTHCAAFLTLTLARKTKAFLRQSASFSAARKACMSSAASGKMRRGTVYGVQGEHGVLADVGVAVLQTGAAQGRRAQGGRCP
jgi:hypothetical protein